MMADRMNGNRRMAEMCCIEMCCPNMKRNRRGRPACMCCLISAAVE